jgi:hypothetical protein
MQRHNLKAELLDGLSVGGNGVGCWMLELLRGIWVA